MKQFNIVIILTTILILHTSSNDIHELYPFTLEFEQEYVHLKERGDYAGALECLGRWIHQLTDPITIEMNIFRLHELMKYPELIQQGLDILRSMESAPPVMQNRFLLDRIDICKNILVLKKGDIRASEAIMNSLSYLDFHIMGPFKNNSAMEFSQSYPPEQGFVINQTCAGALSDVSWFHAQPDRTGIVNITHLLNTVTNTFFYMDRTIHVRYGGEYYLILGKTGFADIWLDGKKIFADRNEHGYCHDQYFIRVHLPEGAHHLLIKAGASSAGLCLSLRIADVSGIRVPAIPYKNTASPAHPGELHGITYSPSLAALMQIKNPDPGELFAVGYLLHRLRLSNRNNNMAARYFSAIPERHYLFSSACYYAARDEQDLTKKDALLNNSIRAHPENIESEREIISQKITYGFIYEAYKHIERIKQINPSTPWHHACCTELFTKTKWILEALKHADMMKHSAYASAGYFAEAHLFFSENDFARAIADIEHLRSLDNYNLSYIHLLADCYEKIGRLDKAIHLLHEAIIIYPNRITELLRLARLIRTSTGTASALPYLAAALNKAPVNKRVLFSIGKAYHYMNKPDLARLYIYRSAALDPDNYQLKQYLKILVDKKNDIDQYLIADDVSIVTKASQRYRHEPVVIHLDENAITVNADGSFERWVHKVEQVNEKSEIKHFNKKYIILDPKTESIEGLSCVVMHNNKKIKIYETYRTFLSEPESRLYYDLEAIVIPLAALAPGDIIDLHYVIKNRSGRDYKNYFGEKVSLGSQYRTLVSNIVLAYPATKRIYCHLNRVRTDILTVHDHHDTSVYHITAHDLPPYKKERSMPHASAVLPSVSFTSFSSWDEYAEWYKSLLKNKVIVDANMRQTLHLILTGVNDPIEKVQRIYALVTDQIRYVGFEFGIGGIQPRSTDATFHSKMGDCKDMSLLLMALLNESGIDADFALVRTKDKSPISRNIPSAGEFNHAICYVHLQNGFFLDATSRDAGIRELPADDRNIDALVLTKTGYNFISTESVFYNNNFIEAINDCVIKENGDVELSRIITKNGNAAPEARHSLKDMNHYIAELNEFWNTRYPGSTVHDLSARNVSLNEPASYSYKVSIPSFSQKNDNAILFDAHITRSNFYQAYAMLKKRNFPLMLPNRWSTRITVRHAVPIGYHIDHIPLNERYDHEKFFAEFTYSTENNLITAVSMIKIKSDIVTTEEYGSFREFTRFIDRKERERIIITASIEKNEK